ncbi:MAG: hypothetical protein ACI4J6_00170 [Oscillospiraceae bacterium]
MSTRELAYRIIDSFSDEQLEGFILLFKGLIPSVDELNEETRAALDDVKNGCDLSKDYIAEAMEETECMLGDPNAPKYNSVEELFEDLNS